MFLFSVQELAQSFNGREIFKGVSFGVQMGEKTALVGPNGIGKTSLLRIIDGIDQPDLGRVDFFTPVQSALLTQNLAFPVACTVRAALEQSALKRPLPGLETDLKIEEALKKFRFGANEDQPVVTLSGGEKTRLQLAKIWLSGADFLLLDEPTNHLDTENLDWLENFVRDYAGTIIMVSHDRYFLDRTVSRVLELRNDGVHSYEGNYSDYRRAKQERFVRDQKTFFDQEKKARKVAQSIQELKGWATKAHNESTRKGMASGVKFGFKEYNRAKAKKIDRQVKNNIKRLERLQEGRIARPKTAPAINLLFTVGRQAKERILLAEGIGKKFGPRWLLENGNFSLRYGEKAGLVGINGSGKTTLLRMIAGIEPFGNGNLWRSPSLRIGYLEQEMGLLNPNRTVLEEVAAVCADQGRMRNLLADLLLTGEAVFKPLQVLSMGERVRVALAKLLLGSYDLLLLDEPTNYLDLESREQLEEALTSFGGSLILISHDRYLQEKIVDTVWAMEEGKIRVYLGGYAGYVSKRFTTIREEPRDQKSRLELELKKARLIGELAFIDRARNEPEYLRLEQEFLETVHKLK